MWILDLILSIWVIIALRNRKRIISLFSENFPNIDKQQFFTWQEYESKSRIWFAWGVFGIGWIGSIILALSGIGLADIANIKGALVSMIVHRTIWFAFMIVASIYGSKAQKIKSKFGITY